MVSSPGEAPPQNNAKKGKKKIIEFCPDSSYIYETDWKAEVAILGGGGYVPYKLTRFGSVSCQYLVLPAINQVGK